MQQHPMGVQQTGQQREEKQEVLAVELLRTGERQRQGKGFCHCPRLWQPASCPHLAYPMGQQTCGWRGLAPARIYLPAPG